MDCVPKAMLMLDLAQTAALFVHLLKEMLSRPDLLKNLDGKVREKLTSAGALHEDETPRAEPLPDLVLHSSPRRNRSVSVSLPIGDDPYVVIGRSLRRLSDQFEADRLPPSYRRQTMDNGVFRRSP